MALVQLFQVKKPTLYPGGLSVLTPKPIVMDASVREEHGLDFTITQTPVETGAVVSDHILENPEAVTLDVVATAHTDTSVPNFIATRHIRIYRMLKDLARLREPFDVVTSLAIYTNMVFRSIRAPRTVTETNALIITCVLRKLEIATVDVQQQMAEAAQEIALGAEDLGAVAGAAETGIAA